MEKRDFDLKSGFNNPNPIKKLKPNLETILKNKNIIYQINKNQKYKSITTKNQIYQTHHKTF